MFPAAIKNANVATSGVHVFTLAFFISAGNIPQVYKAEAEASPKRIIAVNKYLDYYKHLLNPNLLSISINR